MEEIALKIKNWIKNNQTEFWVLAAILLIGAIFRLYNISGYMTFLGDEGRDVIIVRRFLTQLHPPLIGPGTSIGNMYLGPFYYYFMAPALLIAGFSPVGPAIEIGLLGVATVWFIWFIFRKWFPQMCINWGALVASGLYAVSPTVIIYSRSSWNPNIMPFFALLSIYSIWKVWKEKKYNWLLILGIAFAGVIQSHYLGILLIPTIGIFWLLAVRDLKINGKWKTENGNFLRKSFLGFAIFLALMSPLFFFDLRHDWINTKAMYTFFSVRQETVSIKPWTAIPNLYPQFSLFITRLVGGQNPLAGKVTSFLILAIFIYIIIVNRGKVKKIQPEYLLIISWIGFGILGLGLYKQHIYDHYYGFIFAAPFFLIGTIISLILKFKMTGKILSVLLVGYLVVVSLINNPFQIGPNYQMRRAINVAKKIETESGGGRFNLGVIAERNYEDGYKYFLLKDNYPVVNIDSQTKDSITNQLFVVCELEKSKCDPTHNASAAVANFGWSKVETSWEVDGVILYKLVHSI